MSRFLVITADVEFERRVRQAASGMHGDVQSIIADYLPQGPDDVLRVLSGQLLEVLVLGPGLQAEDAIRLASLFDLQYPEISVVLASTDAAEVALPAMRAGIRDLLEPSADSGTIRALLERASLAAAGRRRGLGAQVDAGPQGGRIIAVMSPKGGVGKTTISTNLAIGLGRTSPMRVVIADLDLQFGDVASGLLIDPDRTIADAVTGAAVQDSMVLKSYLSVHPAGIYALCAPRSPSQIEQISAEQVGHLLEQLAREFDYVIVDTAPGLGENVLATLERASDVVWVCGMDIPSIRGLRNGLEILDEIGLVPEQRHVVLNFADKRSGLTLVDVEATIGCPVDVTLPRSRSLPYSTNRGIPVLQDGTKDVTLRGLRQLVERFKPGWEERPHKQLHRRAVVK
ncbi:Type II/IV secretion system ATPase TadZ/CpaE, associated with Flp pilus assembly [Arthrobacter sp. 9V]|uniref:AAA family ATPase n=1 Tax=Arthrobacter sp. 9V TaxID=2653132 RepID=UPI0012F09035|nr:AAA family ATPase [Arthrobacter sp. 9V]VXC72214.1 Type II/IV secretion system ATPase TadZ/CpaE, associated with Flp pilus assembly [Arthrobacter sp. 9V]